MDGRHEVQFNDAAAFFEIIAADGRLQSGAASRAGHIKLVNKGTGRVTFVIEELAWRTDALTWDQAIARAPYRRYCADQLL